MTFTSILFPNKNADDLLVFDEPESFTDLFLDKIVEVIAGKSHEYPLKAYFYTPLSDVDTIYYRHEVMRDLENKALHEVVKTFCDQIHGMRMTLSMVNKLYHRRNQQGWFLDAASRYCDALVSLEQGLSREATGSRGLRAFYDYVSRYVSSPEFQALQSEVKALRAELLTVKYCFNIKGGRVRVRRYESEIDYSVEVEKTFDKFRLGDVKDFSISYTNDAGMNHVEAQILELVAQLFPDVFDHLDRFCHTYGSYPDSLLLTFEQEIQFYFAYLEYMGFFRKKGLDFCYPEISGTSKEVSIRRTYDLALAYSLLSRDESVVCNDIDLQGKERIIIVSGPNQGGKTTFARTFGQIHHLGSLGCPVPGAEALLFLPDAIYTHFEKEEELQNLRGKLQDDLIRLQEILERATPASILILNEVFNSTTIEDSTFLSRNILDRITKLDMLCVFVTFITELSTINEKAVSMISTVVPGNPAQRTYKILKSPADGLVYALSIAEKHGLTYDALKERLRS